MSAPQDYLYTEAIKGAPGPAPWYLSQPASDLSTSTLKLHWERDPDAGPSALKDESGIAYALVSMYNYIWRFSDQRFVVWFSEVPRDGSDPLGGTVRFEIYSIEQLTPLSNIALALQRLKAKETSFVISSVPIAEARLQRNLETGDSSVQFDPHFAQCRELLVLVSNPSWDSTQLNLWVIKPGSGCVSVVPQDWFIKGPYDFGYQWVTRVTREPSTRSIVGDGIRIGAFLLDPNGNSFAKWLQP